MLDLKRIRQNPESVRKALLKRMDTVDFTELLSLDQKRRDLISKVEGLKAKKNEVNVDIPRLKAAGQDVKLKFEEMKLFSAEIKALDVDLAEADAKIRFILEGLPNLPAEDVVSGGKENNEVIHESGTQPILVSNPPITLISRPT